MLRLLSGRPRLQPSKPPRPRTLPKLGGDSGRQHRFIHAGIDEAGYGPNLGPLVMTAIVAEGSGERTPDLWTDLAQTISRAGVRGKRLWVDDSKLVYKGRVGRDRLEAACRALITALGRPNPSSFGGLLKAIGAGTLDQVELSPWIDEDPAWIGLAPASNPFETAAWRIVGVKTVVVGPARFNEGLRATGSKADVHYQAFQTLLHEIWNTTSAIPSAHVEGDKHGGRHFYLDKLSDTFPDLWIDRGPEGPELSQYTVRQGDRRLTLSLRPRADAGNGLVALASIVSKTVRELWMEAFNSFWIRQVPGLKPTAGYPVDAQRFRKVIEPICLDRGLDPWIWWRDK